MIIQTCYTRQPQYFKLIFNPNFLPFILDFKTYAQDNICKFSLKKLGYDERHRQRQRYTTVGNIYCKLCAN